MRPHSIEPAKPRQDGMCMSGKGRDSSRDRTPIEHIFRQVFKREMTPKERSILMGNPKRVQLDHGRSGICDAVRCLE